jgi:hypothetical protein
VREGTLNVIPSIQTLARAKSSKPDSVATLETAMLHLCNKDRNKDRSAHLPDLDADRVQRTATFIGDPVSNPRAQPAVRQRITTTWSGTNYRALLGDWGTVTMKYVQIAGYNQVIQRFNMMLYGTSNIYCAMLKGD